MNSTQMTEKHLVWNAIIHVIRDEGYMIFFRGWVPSYLRLGPHALICFPIFEQIRRVLGLDYI